MKTMATVPACGVRLFTMHAGLVLLPAAAAAAAARTPFDALPAACQPTKRPIAFFRRFHIQQEQ